MLKKITLLFILSMSAQSIFAQFLMDKYDTSSEMRKGILAIYEKFNQLRISGYMQPQYQFAQKKGVNSFAGGNFAEKVDNRFMLRRGRVRFDYVHFSKKNESSVQFAFQFDGTERGVNIRDFWGRLYENKYKLFSITVGMFARPFSYELNLSSSERETPERGRMSQLLMKTERDLGAMLTFEPRGQNHHLKYLEIDAGIFNGQGLAAIADYDSHKDIIARVGLKPYPVTKKIKLSAGVSYLNGGIIQNTKYVYRNGNNSFGKTYFADSLQSNEGKIAPRKYYGADVQIKFKHKKLVTELRAEYMFGTQTSTINTSETPNVLLVGTQGYYIRKFNGAYFYLLHNIVNTQHQIVIKYDWYDPNTNVKNNDIGKPGTALNAADIKYATLGFGYNYYLTENLKLGLWYDMVTNEKTQLPGYIKDIKDNIFTCRLQFKF